MSEQAAPSGGHQPAHHKLITEELVRKCLWEDKGKEAVLQSYEVKDFTKKGDNYMTVVTSVSVQYRKDNEDLHVSYVVKLNPHRSMTALNNFVAEVFAKESGFYAELCPALNKYLKLAGLPELRVARYLYCHLKGGEEALFMEDLRVRGFRMVDRMKGLDEKHCLLLVKELARLHAASILYKEKENVNFLEKFPFLHESWMKDEQTSQEKQDEETISKILVSNIESVMQVATHLGGYDQVIDYLDSMKNKSIDLFKDLQRVKEPFAAATHGDCWSNNILFRYDESGSPVEVMLVDMQIVRYASPTLDLNYLFYTSLKGSDRQNNLDTYLGAYYSVFKEVLLAGGGEVPFTSEEMRRNYKDSNVYGFLAASMVLPIIMNEGGETFDVEVMNEDNLDEMMELSRSRFLRMVANPLVKERFVALFEDIVKHISK